MRKIWYLLKCPEGDETDYMNRCPEFVDSGEMEEILCFQYQRMMRYKGQWHLEKRALLPGYIFLSKSENAESESRIRKESEKWGESPRVELYEILYLKTLCSQENLIEMSRGIIRHGIPIITSGPLQGKEQLIQKIDRHKRTAEIEIPLEGKKKRITVGLEIYGKQ